MAWRTFKRRKLQVFVSHKVAIVEDILVENVLYD